MQIGRFRATIKLSGLPFYHRGSPRLRNALGFQEFLGGKLRMNTIQNFYGQYGETIMTVACPFSQIKQIAGTGHIAKWDGGC